MLRGEVPLVVENVDDDETRGAVMDAQELS